MEGLLSTGPTPSSLIIKVKPISGNVLQVDKDLLLMSEPGSIELFFHRFQGTKEFFLNIYFILVSVRTKRVEDWI